MSGEAQKTKFGGILMCGNNNCGICNWVNGGNWWWIIILILLFCCCGNGNGGYNGCAANWNSCDNNNCGCC